MLIEEEYRRRLHEVTNEVKKRLNYHVRRHYSTHYSTPLLYHSTHYSTPPPPPPPPPPPQVEVDATKRAFEHRHMVAWLERHVTEAMKGKQVAIL